MMVKRRFIIGIIIILLVTLTSCSNNDTGKTDQNDILENTMIENENDQKDENKHYLLVREKKTYYSKNELFYDDVYAYDSNENRIKSTQYDKEGNLNTYFKYYFNEKNLQNGGASYNSDDSIKSTWNIEYNPDGLLTKRIDYDSNGKIDSRIENEYDTKGNQLIHILYDDNGEIFSKDVYTYDENNRKLTGVFYSKVFGTDSYEYEYDNSGNMIQSKSYDVNERLQKIVKFQYDSNNNQISGTSYDKNENFISMWEAEYDDHNEIIKEIDKDKDGIITKITLYEKRYDDAGNCIYELCTIDGDKSYLYEREYILSDVYMINGYTPEFEIKSELTGDNKSENEEFFLENVKKGKEVTFGRYQQNVITFDKTDLEWIVLDVKDGKALLITKYIIDAVPYNETDVDTDWEHCSIRKWLNSDFIEETFTPSEEKGIVLTHITNEDNSKWSTEGGNDTDDYIFFLSNSEAEKYLGSKKVGTLPTKYAVYNGVDTSYCVSDGKIIEGYGHWWLRTPGVSSNSASYFHKAGSVIDFGFTVNGIIGDGKKCQVGIRPALWVKIK